MTARPSISTVTCIRYGYRLTWDPNALEASGLDIIKGLLDDGRVVPRSFVRNSVERIAQVPPRAHSFDIIRPRDVAKRTGTSRGRGAGR